VSALIDANEQYQVVTVFRVDWDTYRDEQITKDLKIRRRSTLVMFKDGKEIDRVVAQTSARAIEPLFQKAIASS